MQLQRLVCREAACFVRCRGSRVIIPKSLEKRLTDRQTDCGGGCKNTVIIHGRLLDEWKLSE